MSAIFVWQFQIFHSEFPFALATDTIYVKTIDERRNSSITKVPDRERTGETGALVRVNNARFLNSKFRESSKIVS